MSPEPEFKHGEQPAIPRHPILAHVTLGGYFAAGVFDILSALTGGLLPDRELYRAAGFLLVLAVAAQLAAIGTGLYERALRTPAGSPARRLTDTHAVGMIGLAAAAVIDLILHLSVYPAAARAPWPVLPATAVLLGCAVAGGHLGAKLVYRLGVGTAYGQAGTLARAAASPPDPAIRPSRTRSTPPNRPRSQS